MYKPPLRAIVVEFITRSAQENGPRTTGHAGVEGVGDVGVEEEGVGNEGVGEEGVGDEGVGDVGVEDVGVGEEWPERRSP